ncbi:MAG: hypothetical protein U0414_40495 [Polyangiaceae bacterium]
MSPSARSLSLAVPSPRATPITRFGGACSAVPTVALADAVGTGGGHSDVPPPVGVATTVELVSVGCAVPGSVAEHAARPSSAASTPARDLQGRRDRRLRRMPEYGR